MADNTTYSQTSNPNDKQSIKGMSRIEKPTIKKRVVDLLFSDKIESLGTYIFHTYIGPGLLSIGYNAIVGAAGAIFQGRSTNLGAPAQSSGSYVPGLGWQPSGAQNPYQYNRPYNPGYSNIQSAYPASVAYYDITFQTEDAARIAISRMQEVMSKYQKVRIADFYDAAEVSKDGSNWTLNANGWRSLANVYPVLLPNGRWKIEMPPVQQL